jgi:hypothetical protein
MYSLQVAGLDNSFVTAKHGNMSSLAVVEEHNML